MNGLLFFVERSKCPIIIINSAVASEYSPKVLNVPKRFSLNVHRGRWNGL